MTLHDYVEDMSGACVAKCKQARGFSMAIEFEIAEGVYILGVIVLCSNLNPGGNAGALAGAGVI
jgi:hypothetical protein